MTPQQMAAVLPEGVKVLGSDIRFLKQTEKQTAEKDLFYRNPFFIFIALLIGRVFLFFFISVDNIVRIDGIWLIDYANARTLKIGDKIGKLTLEKIVR